MSVCLFGPAQAHLIHPISFRYLDESLFFRIYKCSVHIGTKGENSNNESLRHFGFTILHLFMSFQTEDMPCPQWIDIGIWIGCRLISTKELRWSKKKYKETRKTNDWFVKVKIDEDWAFVGLFGWNADQTCLACLPKNQHLNAKIPMFVTYAAKGGNERILVLRYLWATPLGQVFFTWRCRCRGRRSCPWRTPSAQASWPSESGSTDHSGWRTSRCGRRCFSPWEGMQV